MDTYIWYNPNIDIYQKGNLKDYEMLTAEVEDRNSFMIVYELSELSSRLANKLLEELNSMRELKEAG